jgi:hypothetical protein
VLLLLLHFFSLSRQEEPGPDAAGKTAEEWIKSVHELTLMEGEQSEELLPTLQHCHRRGGARGDGHEPLSQSGVQPGRDTW